MLYSAIQLEQLFSKKSAIMLKLAEEILENLRCMYCDRLLNITPIMAKGSEGQICGKCYKILTLEEQQKCTRQLAYETVARILLFPCQYKLQGCEFEFPLNEAENHELECPFRSAALHLNEEHINRRNQVSTLNRHNTNESDSKLSTTFTTNDSTESVIVESRFSLQKTTPALLTYSINISGNNVKDSSLCLQNSSLYSNYTKQTPLNLHINGAFSISTAENLFCKVKINPAVEEFNTNTGRRLSYRPNCSNCYTTLKTEIYHCPFGHDVCKKCKNNTCTLCECPIDSNPQYYCKNYSKGCHVYLQASDRYFHSRNCEFNDFKCLLPECPLVCSTLSVLKTHIKEKHLATIILSNLVVKQATHDDEFWIMLAYDDLFKCKSFVYQNEVEFIVEYVGPPAQANAYKYEIHVKTDNNKQIKLTKSAKCLEWYASALDRVLVITKQELKAVKIDKLNFMYTLNLTKC